MLYSDNYTAAEQQAIDNMLLGANLARSKDNDCIMGDPAHENDINLIASGGNEYRLINK